MSPVRTYLRVGVAIGIGGILLGLAVAGTAALAGGDWYLAPEPWIGIGIALIVWSLALTDAAATLLVMAEPVGWWRLLALPPAAVLGFFWAFYLIVGSPTTGPGGPEHDVGTVFYSSPPTMLLFLVLTVLLGLPLVIRWLAPRPA